MKPWHQRLTGLAALFCGLPLQAGSAPNVLFITVDDLRPLLGCYGDTNAVTPNIDRLAERGMVFNRAYCQQALCNPSRASLFTGLRPDSTGVHDLLTHFRQKVPEVVTLPQHFKNYGYHTQAVGKVFHPAFPGFGIGSNLGDAISWSEPAWLGGPRYYYSPLGVRLAKETYQAALAADGKGPNWAAEARAARARKPEAVPDPDDWTRVNVRILATEAPEVDDDELYDGQVTVHALQALRLWHRLDSDRKPFFLAVGYLRPHLPFIAPRKYWDLYDPAGISLATVPDAPSGAPAPALAVPLDELRDTYPMDVQVPVPGQLGDDEELPYELPRGPLTPEQQRQLRRGYYACVSFVDTQIGRLVTELERLGLANDTVIVIVGDHGFSLGEHGLWGKQTNFEEATRVPLIICPPAGTVEGLQTDALVELVDIYPTICDLAGLPRMPHLEGVSLVPLWKDPAVAVKPAAVSQCPRPELMGYSVRTERYRFTRWKSLVNPEVSAGLELYDYAADPGESVNLADRPEQVERVAELDELLRSLVPASPRASLTTHGANE